METKAHWLLYRLVSIRLEIGDYIYILIVMLRIFWITKQWNALQETHLNIIPTNKWCYLNLYDIKTFLFDGNLIDIFLKVVFTLMFYVTNWNGVIGSDLLEIYLHI